MGQLTFIELFAGIGGFRYGLEAVGNGEAHEERIRQTDSQGLRIGDDRSQDVRNTGLVDSEPGLHQHIIGGRNRQLTCVYSNEWDKYAASIYRRHYGEIDERDITTVDVSEIPDHDLLTAGFPCQDFSIAGKRAGLDGTRGTLFYEIARILQSKRPRHFLLENVKGLLSAQDGKNFPTILGILTDLGYRTEWMVLNSKHFGVPQNRERVFIIGHLRGECRGEVFPLRQPSGIPYDGDSKVAATLQSLGHASGNYRGMNMIQVTEDKPQGYRVYDPEGISASIVGQAGGVGAKTGLYAMRGRNPENPSDRTTGIPTEQRLEKNEDGVTNTITSVQKDNLWHTGTRIRRLTPTECERLQGFPDGWTEYGTLPVSRKKLEKDIEKGDVSLEYALEQVSDTQRYKCLGNAVTTSVITAIGQALLEHIGENECVEANTVKMAG